MKFIHICACLTIITGSPALGQNKGNQIDRIKFYSVVSSGNLKKINAELNSLKSDFIEGKDAFIGGLLMRKAGLETLPREKLKLFKAGRIKLEKAILEDSTNAEYRFIRLMIQENAPGIVRYHGDLPGDKYYIEKSFKTLSPDLQNAIINYSKTSKVLKPSDLINENG